MKKRLLLIILFVIAVSTCNAAGTGFTNNDQMRKYCDTVVGSLQKDKIRDAFDLLKKELLLADFNSNTAELQSLKQLDLARHRFGKTLGSLLVKQEEVAELAVRYTYVVKYEKNLIRWVFIFYKPSERWYLSSFEWDDSIAKLFEE